MDRALIGHAREALFWTNYRLLLTIPSVLARGETFALRVTAIGPDGLPTDDFDRDIVFGASPGIRGLPRSVRLGSGDGGHLRVDGLEASDDDHAWVTAQPEGCPMPVYSNPAWIFDDPPYRIFWGDLHVHTTYSNCSAWACKDPEFCYAYARDAAHLDFAAAADHLRGIVREPGRWDRLKALVRQYEGQGRFLPFLGFESSHKKGFGGDNNAYYRDADGDYFWPDRDDMRGTSPEVPLEDLWRFLDSTGCPYMTVPHHTGRSGKYRSFEDPVYDPDRERVFEIFSCWGSSEMRSSPYPLMGGNSDKPCYFQDALKAGCRYGVIASSDDHRTMPGGEHKAVGMPAGLKAECSTMHHGLAAVRAAVLTRESVWDALCARQCYGTTFPRVLLDVRVDDVGMGQEGHVSGDSALQDRRIVKVRALAGGGVKSVATVIRDGQEIGTGVCDGEQQEFAVEDEAPLKSIAVRGARFHPAPFVSYYVRLTTGHGQTVWSSPIWLDPA